MARGLARCGADVAIWGTNAERNDAAVAELGSHGTRVRAWRCDVGDEDAVTDAFAGVLEHFGRVDSCFANAGIGGSGSRFVDTTLEEWRPVELARYGIHAHSLVVGWTETPLASGTLHDERFERAVMPRMPQRRWGVPDDFARLAVYLAGGAGGFHTGDEIVVDGAYSIF
jgi:NAD(P)-dependent dehydrogenase (short-subunit alcohol dehydrogenase family)